MKAKLMCEKCYKERNVRSTIMYKGRILCNNCYRNLSLRIPGECKTTLEKALNKTYTIKGYYCKKNGRVFASRSFPSVLAGKTIKLILINEKIRK